MQRRLVIILVFAAGVGLLASLLVFQVVKNLQAQSQQYERDSEKNTWASSVTVADLKKIWEPGAQRKVTRWNQVRTEWPNQEIHLFGGHPDDE